MLDTIRWVPLVHILKYDPSTVRELTEYLGHEPTGPELRWLEEHDSLAPDDVAESVGNALVNGGLQRIGDLIIGTGGAAFSKSPDRGVGGVGNSTTAFSAGQTALQGANQFYKALDAAPTSSTGQISANVTFQTGEGNFAWEEWCWAVSTATPVSSSSFNTATSTGTMLNRKVQSLGTKASGAVWTLQATVTLS